MDDLELHSFTSVVETAVQQTVRCEIRNGQAFFIFQAYDKSATSVRADEYLMLLVKARAHPQPSTLYPLVKGTSPEADPKR